MTDRRLARDAGRVADLLEEENHHGELLWSVADWACYSPVGQDLEALMSATLTLVGPDGVTIVQHLEPGADVPSIDSEPGAFVPHRVESEPAPRPPVQPLPVAQAAMRAPLPPKRSAARSATQPAARELPLGDDMPGWSTITDWSF